MCNSRNLLLIFVLETVYYSAKKRQYSFDILKAFSSDTRQSMKRRTVAERLTEAYSLVRLHVIGCV